MGAPPTVDPGLLRQDLACLLCGSASAETLHRKDPFRIVRCRGCSMVYTVPRLPSEELARMYQEDYWRSESARDFGYTDYLADEELYLRTFRLRARLLKRHRPPPASLLDVGCAAGYALKVARELGYDGYGVELSGPMAREAEKRAGAGRVHAGVLEEGLFEGRRFDVITMWDVVEHVEDPVALLATARRMLAPDGVVILETQNVASLFARLLGVRWQHYKFQEHLYHFDPRTLRALLEKAGLRLLEHSARLGGKYVSLRFIAERAARVHPILSALLRPLRLLGNPTLYVNLFDEMLVVARPESRGEARDG